MVASDATLSYLPLTPVLLEVKVRSRVCIVTMVTGHMYL